MEFKDLTFTDPTQDLSDEELESERQWDALFARSPDTLLRMAEEAWADYEAGRTEPLDPDTL